MKRTLGLLGTIVLAVLFAFLITSCPDLLPDQDNNESGEPGNDPGNNNKPDNNKPDNDKPTNDAPTNDKPDNGPNTKTGSDIITNANDIAAYLNEQTGTKEAPAILIVKFDLGAMNNPNSNWQKMLVAINTAGKYVTLDMSACTVSAAFDNASSVSTGKDKIVTLTLPDALDVGITDGTSSAAIFMHYTNLESVTGKNVKTIGKYAFAGCGSLITVNFPNADNIGDHAFTGCTGLTSVSFPKAETINPSAFRNCTNLAEVDFPKVQVIGDNAFNSSSIESANFPEVITINPSAFLDCTDLVEAQFPKAQVIGDFAFSGSGLESAGFPEVITIGQSAFRDCTDLIDIDFPTAAKIGNEAFRNCTSLSIARFHANPSRTTTGDPVSPWEDSIVFFPDALRGCNSLVILDIRNAWNVYFARGVLAEIGTHLDLYLFDDNGAKSYGHPQTDMYLGYENEDDPNLIAIKGHVTEIYGRVTLNSIKIFAPVVSSGVSRLHDDISPNTSSIYHDIRGRYTSYFVEEKDPISYVPIKFRVEIERLLP